MISLPPRARISGSLITLGQFPPITAAHMETLLHEIYPPTRRSQYREANDLDFAYEDLGLPDALKKFCHLREGLVLVTGPTGIGKSTTLAAIIDHINVTSRHNIVTVEEPIEFIHHNKQSVIVHREAGAHTSSFADALRGAMRADPDIILIGEMRHIETKRLALGCASMGMLVFGTLHTNSAPKTIDCTIDSFPGNEQNHIRIILASCLRGVAPNSSAKNHRRSHCSPRNPPPHEALGGTLRSGNIAAIRNIIEGSRVEGMISMDSSLRDRYDTG